MSEQKKIEWYEKEIIRLKNVIEGLEEEISFFKKDGLEGSLYALNYQINLLNKQIISAKISLEDKDDKTFDRFWKVVNDISKVHTAIAELKAMSEAKTKKSKGDKDTEAEKLEKKPKNIMEKLLEDEQKRT